MKTLNKIENEKLEMNGDGTELKTTLRNQLKKDLTQDIATYLENMFADNGNIDVGLTADGVGVSIYNEQLDASISFVIDTTFKKLSYDLQAEIDGYQFELEQKQIKKAEKEKAKQAKIKKDNLMREKKALEKQLQEKVAKGQVKMKQVKNLLD